MPLLTPDFLENVPLMRGLTDRECSQLLQLMIRERFDAGSTVVTMGEVSRGLHLIVEGEARVVLDVPGQGNPFLTGDAEIELIDHAKIARLALGSVFGEVSFFHGGEHSATIEAATDLELLTLGVSDYESLLRNGNLLAYKIALNAAHILAERLRQADQTIADLVVAHEESPPAHAGFASRIMMYAGAVTPRFFS